MRHESTGSAPLFVPGVIGAAPHQMGMPQEEAQRGRNQTQSNPKEIGAPQCTGATAATTERRLMNVAIVNCQSSPVPIQSNAQNVPVAAFGSFFLTHAAPVSGTNKPFAEFRGLIGRGNGAIYDQVQLYR